MSGVRESPEPWKRTTEHRIVVWREEHWLTAPVPKSEGPGAGTLGVLGGGY